MENEIKINYRVNESNKKIQLFGEDFVNNNKEKCKMIIEGKEYELLSNFEINNLSNKEKLELRLNILSEFTDMKSMFYKCESLFSICNNFSKFNRLKI